MRLQLNINNPKQCRRLYRTIDADCHTVTTVMLQLYHSTTPSLHSTYVLKPYVTPNTNKSMCKETKRIQTGLGLLNTYYGLYPVYILSMLLLRVKIQTEHSIYICIVRCNPSCKCVDNSANTIRKLIYNDLLELVLSSVTDGRWMNVHHLWGLTLLGIAMPPLTHHSIRQLTDGQWTSTWCNKMWLMSGIEQMNQRNMGRTLGVAWWGVGAFLSGGFCVGAALGIFNTHTIFTRVFLPTDGGGIAQIHQSRNGAMLNGLMAIQCVSAILYMQCTNAHSNTKSINSPNQNIYR